MTQISLAKCKVDQLVSLCEEFGNQPGELINILHKAQGLIGYLPREVQEVIARQLNIPVSKVYGVVTFYSFFTMTPKGEHPISDRKSTRLNSISLLDSHHPSDFLLFSFFNDTATTEIYTLSLHDALPIWLLPERWRKF